MWPGSPRRWIKTEAFIFESRLESERVLEIAGLGTGISGAIFQLNKHLADFIQQGGGDSLLVLIAVCR